MKKATFLATFIALTLSTSTLAMPNKPDPLANTPYFNQTDKGFDLKFTPKNYRTLEVKVGDSSVKFRAFEKIVYVANPIEPDYQTLNIYVPEAYFRGEKINGYSAETAPIFYLMQLVAICRLKRQPMMPKVLAVAVNRMPL